MIQPSRDAEPVALIVQDTFVDWRTQLANSERSIKALIVTGRADAGGCGARVIRPA